MGVPSPVAQWWSKKLLTSRLPVRVWPGEPFFWNKKSSKSRLGTSLRSDASLAGGAIFLLEKTSKNKLKFHVRQRLRF